MSSSITLSPNPKILTWARLESGFELDVVARRLQVTPERIEAWESGLLSPTVRQANLLADFYKRPLSIFFQLEPPPLEPLATQYRRLVDVEPGHESPELRLAIRQMLNQREIALDLMEELGDDILPFELSAHQSEPIESIAARLRTALGITEMEQLGWRDAYHAWRSWRSAIERNGILVFQFTRVPVDEVRGLALFKTPLPIIGVNSKETVESRPYTAIHELVHLLLAQSQEEASALEDKHSIKEWRKLERFAEGVASRTLLPESLLIQMIEEHGQVPTDIHGIRRLARRVKISPLALATRLWASRLMSWGQYRVWRKAWDKHLINLPASSGFATPVDKTLGRVGQTYAQLVLDALDANRITAADSSRYLELRFHQLGKLREKLTAGYQGAAADV